MTECGLDRPSFELGRQVGEIGAWCEAVAAGVKPMGLSAPFAPEEYDVLLPFMTRAAERRKVYFQLERDLCTTDLFGEVDLEGRWVFVITRDESIWEEYLAVKQEVARLERTGEYRGAPRAELARRLGRLLGYSEGVLDARLPDAD